MGSMQKRRSAAKSAAALLEAIRSAQLNALENTPRDFRGAGHCETGAIAADALEQAIGILSRIF